MSLCWFTRGLDRLRTDVLRFGLVVLPFVAVPVTGLAASDSAVSFINNVTPVLERSGCNTASCHGAKDGKGGLKLSLFGATPRDDLNTLVSTNLLRLFNTNEPNASVFLKRLTGDLPHEGAPKIVSGTEEYRLLAEWISKGAPWMETNVPAVTSLDLTPVQRTAPKDTLVQMKATAHFSNGSAKDLTHFTAFTLAGDQNGRIESDGQLKTTAFGECVVVATYLRQSAVARIVVPQTGVNSFPKLTANNRVDELVYEKLKALNVPPSELCSDEEFLRRVYLDTIGLLPTAPEARSFLNSRAADKRQRLIDELLARDEFADFRALKWGDLLRIKSEYLARVWPKGVAAYHRWVRDSIAANKPYDQFARELLTASGSSFRDGAANFFRALPNKDPQTMGETAALVFMGARIGCARCHAHPTENWTLDDDAGLAAFFAQVSFKNTGEWKEEIIFANPKATFKHPTSKQIVKAKFPGGRVAEFNADEDPRAKFADWLTAPGNPWFARNIANRTWFWLLGRGLVNEPDDLRPTSPPENPALLDYLAQELVSSRFDSKYLFRLILNSRTYQISSQPNRWNAHDTSHFSHYIVKRLTAEQMLDAISQVTGSTEKFTSHIPEPYSYWPATFRATQIEDGNVECAFLEMFGRPSRDTPYESERDSATSLRQALYFINSDQLEAKISSGQQVNRLLKAGQRDEDIIDQVFLNALSRFPTEVEKRRLLDHLAKNSSARAQAVRDIVWAVLTTKEFAFNH